MNLHTNATQRGELSFLRFTCWPTSVGRVYLTDLLEDFEKISKRVTELESALKKARDEADGCAEDRHYYGVYPRHKELVGTLDEVLKGGL